MQQRLGVAADERERCPKLVADRGHEALAQLLERADRADVADDRGRPRAAPRVLPGRRAERHRRVAARDGDRAAVGAPDRRLAIGDRPTRRHDLGERAGSRGMATGDVAAEDLVAGSAEGVAGRDPEQPLAGRVEADDATVAVDLDDEVGRAVDDGRQLAALALERLAQAGTAERDRQLVACELGDANAIGIGRPAVVGPERRAGSSGGRRTGSRLGRPRCRRTTPGLPLTLASVVGGRARDVTGSPSPTLAIRTRSGPSAPPSQIAPRSTAARRTASWTTDLPRPSGVPPEATSWLSWYWANSASASRWASSNARRLSSSSVAILARRLARSFTGLPARPAAGGTRRRPDRGGRRTARRGASPGRGGRSRSRVERIPTPPASHAARHAVPMPSPASIAAAKVVGGGGQRVEDRLVARLAPAAAGQAVRRRTEHGRDRRAVQGRPSAGDEPGLDAGRAVERPGRATDRGDETMPDRPEEVARRRVSGQFGQQLVDRPEADDEVVAVVAVAENGVELGRARGRAGRRSVRSERVRPATRARRSSVRRRCPDRRLTRRWSMATTRRPSSGSAMPPSVGGVEPGGNARRPRRATRAALHRTC